MARRIAAVVFSLGCLQTSAVSALGLGELTLDSFLNEPFKAKVDLLNTEGLSEHQIRIRLATTDDFNRMGVDRAYFLTSITFEIEIDDSGRGQILLSSEAPVLEPFLDFIVEARWPSGRLLREYTVLVDPPVFDSQAVRVSASDLADKAEGVKKKSQPGASSGTQVKLEHSNLAPGAMPSRKYGSDASTAPIAGDRYMIRRDETLWSIAKRARPEGTSINQTMLDIQRLNPKAFIGGNINRIKAGYIIYLPQSSDISSDDIASASQAVQQQNQDWRENVSHRASGGGSLRISTGAGESPTDAGSGRATGSGSESSNAQAGGSIANSESLDRAERDKAEVEQRLSAMSDQVDTLERIVSVKDEQIAALQKALAEANVSVDATIADGGSALATDEPEGVISDLDFDSADESGAEMDSAQAPGPATESEPELVAEATSDSTAEPESESEPEPEQAKAEEPKPVATPKAVVEEDGGFFGNFLYLGGLLLAAIFGILWFLSRRGKEAEEEPETPDAFADITLEDESLEVVAEPDSKSESESAVPEPEPEVAETPETPARSRGYGERKNDEYANDMDSVDALAEADIYIAYGRFPQAIDLLKTAIDSEPLNPAYKLKLMEVSSEAGDHAELMKQYGEIKQLGDADTLARADEILRAGDEPAAGPIGAKLSENDPLDLSDDLDLDLDLPDLEMDEIGSDINLEEEFGELEIEAFDSELSEDDLDLSRDFDGDSAGDEAQEMIFATESDPVSTKLDLARAYLDMGDQDGARVIFEEVVAEGNAEQKQEALALLERLG